jgi:propanol-preferring alcohol dehydrogenase
MKAMVLDNIISSIEEEPKPLHMVDLPIPSFDLKQILVKISACGICHTELDEIEGRLQPKLPVILGHQIVGREQIEEKKQKNSRSVTELESAGFILVVGNAFIVREETKIYARIFKVQGVMLMGVMLNIQSYQRISLTQSLKY